MDRHAQALQLAEQLLEDVELTRLPVDRLVLKATRLARLTEDEVALTWLAFEVSGCTSSEAGKRHMSRTGRWTDREKGEGTWSPAAAIQASLNSCDQAIQALKVDSVGGEWASIALREQRGSIASLSSTSQALSAILARVTGLIHDFTSRVYHELQFSDAQAGMFESVRQDVDARLARLGGEALVKIESINERFRVGDTEAVSHAMTTARRLIDSVADSVFPGRSEPYKIGDEPLVVDESKVLNRILAFLHSKGATDGRRARLRRTFSDVYGRVSKGIHDDVDIEEARFIFLQTYVALGEVVSFA